MHTHSSSGADSRGSEPDVEVSSALLGESLMGHVERVRSAIPEPYTIVREIGRGGMAVVYLAQDAKHERPVAIKVLSRDFASVIGIERFLREIRIVAQITHPHVLPLLDSGETDGLLYYVMPFIAEGSLKDRITGDGPLPIDDVLSIASQVAGALHCAHEANVVHRDVKPENILMSGDQALLADFGIARPTLSQSGEELTYAGSPLGSPLYLSPEQGLGDRVVDRRSDVYGLGCVVYEMLTGSPPFNGETAVSVIAMHAIETIPSACAKRREVPAHVDRAVRKAMAKNPDRRFETSLAFSEALGDEHGGMSSTGLSRTRFSTARSIAVVLCGTLAVGVASMVLQALSISVAPGLKFTAASYASAWLTTILGVYFVFERADTSLSAEAKLCVARWLRDLDPIGRIRSWPASFAALFDTVFGTSHFSLRCFLRSMAASFVATLALLFLWAAMRPEDSLDFWSQRGLAGISIFVTITLILNVAADYISLLETRLVLGRMTNSDPTDGYSLHLAADTLLTLLIWFLFFTGLPLILAAVLLPVFGDASLFLRSEIWGTASPGFLFGTGVTIQDILALRSGPSAMPVGIWFYSTFLTSAWIWLYAMSGTLVRATSRIGGGLDSAKRTLNIAEEPVRVVGFAVMLLVSALFAIGAILQL